MIMKWIIILLVLLNAGWMLFDGTHALVTGDYVTPASGDHAGQLGPWAGVVQSLGIDPHSTLIKVVHVAYGLSALAVLSGFAAGQDWGRSTLTLVVVLGLWYLPIGTAVNMICLILLFLQRS